MEENRIVQMAEEARRQVPIGIYRHYKGNRYQVLGTAIHSETLEMMVVYKALYGAGETWVRPLSMWHETVEVDGKTMPRFALEQETPIV